MNKKYRVSLFIFRRDLRLDDNSALIAALEQSQQVIPCFILDPRQITQKNQYASIRAIQFMFESLVDLAEQLQRKDAKLFIFYGKAEEVVAELIKKVSFDAVFIARDYTPFALKRDAAISRACSESGKNFEVYDDALINPPESIYTKAHTPYLVFTHYYHAALLKPIMEPKNNLFSNYYTEPIALEVSMLEIFKEILPSPLPTNYTAGGSKEAQKIIDKLEQFEHYAEEHDFPSIETTHLSAHNKFGTISIRRLYQTIAKKLDKNHPLIRQLYWRDFFTYIAFHFPKVFGSAFHEKYGAIQWNPREEFFDRWCNGTTGFPIVDAGMRQLNQTGFMHNRVRLIVGSFLVKDLHIDWRKGEQYFAKKLIDYDPCVNNGNWQWVASTGCDATPYFRIFNPWLQQKKFDPDCTYIKTWVPELKYTAIADIHAWYKKFNNSVYFEPIIDHTRQIAITKKLYKQIY